MKSRLVIRVMSKLHLLIAITIGHHNSGHHNITYHTVCPNKVTMFPSDVKNVVKCDFKGNGRLDLIELKIDAATPLALGINSCSPHS
jgi:hypothetical protein